MNRDAGIGVADLDTAGYADWDEFVHAHPEGTIFHLSAWKRVFESAFGHDVHLLVARRGAAIEGVLPLVHVRSPLFGNSLVSTGFMVYGGPLATSDIALAALDEAADALAHRVGADHIEYRLRRPLHPDWPCRNDLYYTFRKPLPPNPDAGFKALPRSRRRALRKAMDAGLSGRRVDEVDAFCEVMVESYRNLGTPCFHKTYFRHIKDALGDACEILLIGRGRDVVAGVMSFCFRDEVMTYYGGGTAGARQLGANDLMYWEVMRRASERGCRLFDFGRSKAGTGAFDFKKLWGFRPEPLHYEYRLRKGSEVPDINPLNPKYRIAIAVWKRLPLWIARRLGPPIARQLA